MNYRVRALGTADAHDYHRVRLAALRLHPEAFGSAYEDEAVLEHAQVVERLSTPGLIRFGGFADGTLVGLCGLALQSGAKQRHKAAAGPCSPRLFAARPLSAPCPHYKQVLYWLP